MNLNNYEKHIYSQNHEDGITMKLIEMIYDDPTNKYYVEFGVQSGVECNTRILLENYKWNGLLMDGDNENPDINLHKEFITKENILGIFKKYNVPKNINLFSLDIDYNDFHILEEIIKEYTADIIILEYNASIPPNESKVVKYEAHTGWDGSMYFGGSLLAFNKLLSPKGYTLVCCNNNGVNAFFVKQTLLDEKNIKIANAGSVDLIYKKPAYNHYNGGHPPDTKNREFLEY